MPVGFWTDVQQLSFDRLNSALIAPYEPIFPALVPRFKAVKDALVAFVDDDDEANLPRRLMPDFIVFFEHQA